jgi:MFS transporter, LPLT family, lysophospholipid transporter
VHGGGAASLQGWLPSGFGTLAANLSGAAGAACSSHCHATGLQSVPVAFSRVLPSPLASLVLVQAASALAEQALLVLALARLADAAAAPWQAVLLKLVLVLAYVLLAPWAGRWADALPRRPLLAAALLAKALAMAMLSLGVAPLACLALAGLGAAVAAPVRYGLVADLLPRRRWLAANGWLEGCTVAASVAGIGLGGWLVAPGGAGSAAAALGLAGLQGVALLPVLALPAGAPAAHRQRHADTDFVATLRCLAHDRLAALSLTVTALVWGVAAVLQMALLQWAAERLALPLHEATRLPLAVAAGVVLGAAAAGRWLPLEQAPHLLPLGLLLGLGLGLCTAVRSWPLAVALLMLLGVLAGALVVAMNALLQQRGQALVGTGRAIAAQNAVENLSMLGMLGLQALLLAAGVQVVALLQGLGLLVAAVMGCLWWQWQRQRRSRATTRGRA